MSTLNKDFWKNKRVMITGHTGFKGAWASLILSSLGCRVFGCALKPKKNQILFKQFDLQKRLKKSKFLNICNEKLLNDFVEASKPEIIFHFAAQPYVIDSYKQPILTLKTNVMGTMNVLNLKKYNFVKLLNIVTSDKCYDNSETKKKFSENSKLGGNDFYSSSKACCELIANAYRKSFCKNKNIITVRAGNVIGGGDFGNYRLMADLFKSIQNKKKLIIRNPNFIRPWQHIFDVLNGYFFVTEKCYKNPLKFSGPWNFGPEKNGHLTVAELIELFNKKLKIKMSISHKADNAFSEEKYLFLNINKAKKKLRWKPKLKVEKLIKYTLEWYQNYYSKKDMLEFSLKQIKNFGF